MAAYSHQRPLSRASDDTEDGHSQLPNGSCNFRHLTSGVEAPTCGCKRFWLNNGHAYGNGDRAFCFCGHHACFHNVASAQQRISSLPSVAASVCRRLSGQLDKGDTPEGYHRVAYAGASPPRPPAGLGIRPGPQSQSQSLAIDTRVWDALNAFARNQEDRGHSESTLPSTAVPSVAGEPTQDYRPMGPPVSAPSAPPLRPGMEEYLCSATEVATPSVAGTPDLRAFAAPGTQARLSPAVVKLNFGGPGSRASQGPPSATSEQPQPQQSAASLPSLSTGSTFTPGEVKSILQSYGRRLDVMESMSFSHVPLEEVQDKFELFDGRLLDLEHWRLERDQDQHTSDSRQPCNSKRRRLLPIETSSFNSDASFDSHAAAHAEAAVLATLAANAETRPRIDALETRIADLESAALPSFARPWQVQVVMLPWGRQVQGIWYSSAEATQQSLRSATQDAEEWTGAQALAKSSFQSAANGAWTTESIQVWADEAQEWLSPKACGPTGAVFQRLASRGLVQDITLTASDSRHVFDVVARALGNVADFDYAPLAEMSDRFQGLKVPFVPLRKVRKSSRLRFLSPAEMVTPASWTAGFLESSIIMKVNDGRRRLYVTTPAAYLQALEGGCSWRTIRELPAVDVDGAEQAGQVDESVAIEACWTHNDRLDRQRSLHPSLASHASHASQWSMCSQPPEGGAEIRHVDPPSPLSEARPLRQRTASLPSSHSAGEQAHVALPKRRVAPFETAAPAPLADQHSVPILAAKRRRISTSPESERRGVNFTPRLSREPPSPFHSENTGEARSQGASSRRRGTTPFAYATPHSNSNYIGRMDIVGGDGDTEAGTDIVGAQSERGEEEWDGVQEDTNAEPMQDEDGDSAVDEAEIDDGDVDERLAIYEG